VQFAPNLQTIVLASVGSSALLFGVVLSLHGYHTKIADAKKNQQHNGSISKDPRYSELSITNTAAATGAIQLSAKEASGDYRWINAANGAINPTMNFAVNTNKIIQIQNPTDTKHQLIIDVNGKQLTSGDIASDNSGLLSFKPGVTGAFQYHCLYHPTTMKGIFQVG
jgi:plastocyanin